MKDKIIFNYAEVGMIVRSNFQPWQSKSNLIGKQYWSLGMDLDITPTFEIPVK